MGREGYRVFSGGKIAHLTTKNRLVRSATYEAAMKKNGRTTKGILNLYRDLAGGGVGTIITGFAAVMRAGKSAPRQICAYEDRHIGEIARIADAIHEGGNECRAIVQLVHVGRQVYFHNREGECVGPSGTPSPVFRKKARALSTEEIRDITGRFADAVARVKKAGFDGAQLHGAHGYLLSSFLSPYTNSRIDEYGGSVENRVRIVREIMDRARDMVGDFPILIKMNCDDCIPGGIDIDSFPELAREVAATGVDAIEVSGGMMDCLARSEEELGFPPIPLAEAHTRIGKPEKQSYFSRYVENLDLDIPIILVGGNRNIERLEKIMSREKVDFFAFSRPLINEPDLPRRWLDDRGSNNSQCISCNTCLSSLLRGPVTCVFKQSRIKYKTVKRWFPRTWKAIMG